MRSKINRKCFASLIKNNESDRLEILFKKFIFPPEISFTECIQKEILSKLIFHLDKKIMKGYSIIFESV